jgi:catechol 2,3-dioxygenase-like lactoylglutathione lyase family enzyme
MQQALYSRGITFVGIRTQYIDKMKKFAEQVLGYEKTHDTGNFVAFTTPQGQRFELFAEDEPAKQHFPLGVPVTGFEVPDFEKAVAWLGENGIEILTGVHEGESGTRWAHFQGPDSNIYEFVYHPDHSHSTTTSSP